ncbi:hypothetical protein COO60DRAFT_1535919 [Scenedesmus sp. NREL 46B-D3]|nr:hypothetical protein COO60DRAFT_1535919 [Scenedesmus sp. NREL 46B-D3]
MTAAAAGLQGGLESDVLLLPLVLGWSCCLYRQICAGGPKVQFCRAVIGLHHYQPCGSGTNPCCFMLVVAVSCACGCQLLHVLAGSQCKESECAPILELVVGAVQLLDICESCLPRQESRSYVLHS